MNSLEFRRYEQSLLLLYKCIKGNRPSYISDFFKFRVSHSNLRGGGCNLIPRGGYCHIWAISVCAAVKGMVFKQFILA